MGIKEERIKSGRKDKKHQFLYSTLCDCVGCKAATEQPEPVMILILSPDPPATWKDLQLSFQPCDEMDDNDDDAGSWRLLQHYCPQEMPAIKKC